MVRKSSNKGNSTIAKSGRRPEPAPNSVRPPLAHGWNDPQEFAEGKEVMPSLGEIVSRQRERWLRNRAEKARLKAPKELGPVDKAFANWISDLQRRGWTAYFLTFVFNQLSGQQPARIRQMARRIKHLYSSLVNFVVRRAKGGKDLTRLPLMIAVSESVWRSACHRVSVHDMRPNDGDHFHAVYLLPPWAKRQALPFDARFAAKRAVLIPVGDTLRNVDIRPMDGRSKQVWGYIQKTRTRNRDAQDDVLLLPEVRHPVAWRELVQKSLAETAEKSARLKAARLARDHEAALKKSTTPAKQRPTRARQMKIALPAPKQVVNGFAGSAPLGSVRTRHATPNVEPGRKNGAALGPPDSDRCDATHSAKRG